jgi:molecular chaperone GrpE
MTNKEKASDQPGQPEAGSAEAGEATEAASPEELALLLEDARGKADEHYSQLLRTRAELENLHKRSERELENAHKFALEKFLLELLPVRDSMEMGLTAAEDDNVDPAKLREGMELTLKMMAAAMEKFGIKSVYPEGEKFNPELHQAMSMQEVPDVEPNTVVNVVQKGYQLNERLVRPALVIVSTGAKAPDRGKVAREYGEGDAGGGQIDDQA